MGPKPLEGDSRKLGKRKKISSEAQRNYLIISDDYPLLKQRVTLKFKNLDYKETMKNINHSYENTLIERDIKDPSPTINASFRVIGRRERSSFNHKTYKNDDSQYEGSLEYENFDEQSLKNKTINQPNSIISDWDDETYSAW